MPPLKQVLFAGVGFVGTPLVEGFVNTYVPTSISTNSIGKYAVKIGSAILLAFAVKKFVGPEEGKMVAVGGGAYVLTSAVADFAPAEIKAFLGMSSYVQPNIGAYIGEGQIYNGMAGMLPAFGSAAVQGSAERFARY